MMGSTAKILAMMPGLEVLDLCHGNPLYDECHAFDSCEVLEAIAGGVKLPALQRFVLHGFHCAMSALSAFLQNHPGLTHLELHEIHLTDEDNWQPFFDHIRSTKMPHLQDVLLDSLWADKLEHLGMQGDGPEVWTEKRDWFPCLGGGRLLHTRRFTRAQLQQGLHFVPHTPGPPLDSPQRRTWHMHKDKEYHPR